MNNTNSQLKNLDNEQDLGDSPPNPRLGDGCVPQAPCKIILAFFVESLFFGFVMIYFFLSEPYCPKTDIKPLLGQL
ncbi:hypothetical protein ACX27_17890 [Nostoc piscinale CENA21]|uniref:Uncharacterized protein n=1 Tax=Nostoc piscinale CENA21 TaxID=224013 RepID=A0A0M5MH03_9NOSO|nr:hypothetical protein ACX27_17890 [Nostoc piscinale CENA21]